MAPARGTKRAAPQASADEKKVAEALKQHGVTKANYKAIVEGVEHPFAAEGITEDCRKMLVSMVPNGLCVPVDERHEHQTLAVDMIGEVLSSVRARMEENIKAEDVKVEQATVGMSTLEDEFKKAETTFNEAAEASEERKQELAVVSKALLGAKSALAEREEEQRKGDASLVQARADKESIETVMSEHFAKLRDGDWEIGQAKQHYDALEALVGKLALDASLVTALPGTMMKKPGDRGQFDEMVVAQLAQNLSAKVEELAATLEAGAPASAERARAAEAARTDLENAKTAQQEAANALRTAQDKQREMNDLMEAARQKVKDCEPQRLQAEEAREAKKAELQLFQELNIGCYESLKDRVSAKRRKLLAAEAAAAEAAEAAAAQAAAAEAEAAAEAPASSPSKAAALAEASEAMTAAAAWEAAEAGA